MDMKRFSLAVVVAFAFLIVTTYVVHGIWLRWIYDLYPDSWRPMSQQVAKAWILLAGRLLFTVMFAWVYLRGMEKKSWIGQGIRYGGVIWLLVSVPAILSMYVLFRVPYQLALIWMSVTLIQVVLMGLIVAYLLRPAAPSPAASADAKKG